MGRRIRWRILLDLSWHPTSRVVHEPEPGLTPARLRALEEVRGELIIFVDDDNVLDPSYLTECMLIASQFPHLGAWGGQSSAGIRNSPGARIGGVACRPCSAAIRPTMLVKLRTSTCP